MPCLDVLFISVNNALLWHAVEVRSRNRINLLFCLGEEAATRLAADLYTFIDNHPPELMGSETDRLSEVREKLHSDAQ